MGSGALGWFILLGGFVLVGAWLTVQAFRGR